MTAMEREMLLMSMGLDESARLFRIKGSTEIVKASSIKQAIRKLVDEDDFTYTPHWYNGSNRKSWASVETSWGYRCTVEEI